ncbi:MAG: sulfatase [Chitinophagaceae bacterium]|nr:sulfatase [Chitinophagaceae bacterium]
MRGLIFFLLLVVTSAVVKAQTRPNIILFFVDDMGWVDTSVPFGDSMVVVNKRYHTPNMQRLASEGIKFTNAYATPVCTPTRISLLTGINAAHHGVTNWTSPVKDRSTDVADDEMAPASWLVNGLSSIKGTAKTIFANTYPQLLKQAGYFTVHVGKAHWGSMGTPGSNPYNLGFMVNIAGHAAGHPQSYLAKDNFGNITGKAVAQAVPDLEEYFGSDTFLTEALTLEAIKALEAPINNKQPFYLNMAHYAIHTPIQGDKRYVQKYIDAGLDSIEANYASLIEGMDKSLGDLMNYLKEKGIEKNTVILFMSDNGGLSLVPPRGGVAHTHNLPLKSGKGSVYEGGIRVPMIVKWPGVVKANTRSDQYIIVEDFFPSILEIAGLKNYNIVQQVDGKSFVSQLKNPGYKNSSRSLVWHFPNKWQPNDGPGINYKSAIRQGDWKLIYNMRDGSKELYNLQLDVGELQNLASVERKKVDALAILLSHQLRQWKAVMPSFKTTGKIVPLPDRVQ